MKFLVVLSLLIVPAVAVAVDVLTSIDRLGDSGFQHSDDLAEIRVLSDGKRVLSSSQDGSACLWDLGTGDLIQRFSHEDDDYVWGLAIREGEKEFIAGGSGGAAVRYEIATGKILKIYEHSSTVYRVDIHPNQKWFVAGDSKNLVKLWDIESGDLIRDFAGHEAGVYTVIFNKDGSRIISGSNEGEVKLWDTETGKCLKTLRKEKKFKDIFTIMRSPDGSSFAMISADKLVRVFECDTLKLRWEVKQKKGGQVLAWSPDGTRIAVASKEATLDLLDAKTGKFIKGFPTGDGDHTPICYTPDGKILISGGNKFLHLYNSQNGESMVPSGGIPMATNFVNALAVSNDGQRVYSEGNEGFWNLWTRADEEAGIEEQVSAHMAKGRVSALVLSPDGMTLAVGESRGDPELRHGETGKLIRKLKKGGRISAFSFLPDGKSLIGGGSDDVAYRWSVDSGEILGEYSGHANDIGDVAVSADGLSLVTSGEDKTVKIWKIENGNQLASFGGFENAPDALAYIDSGRSLLMGLDEKELMGRLLKELPKAIPLEEERVGLLTDQLADPSFEIRNKATQELAAMGIGVLVLLEKKGGDDPEVSRRINGVSDIISGVSDKNGFAEAAIFDSEIFDLVGDPMQRFWAAAIGSGAHGAIVIGEVIDQKAKVLQTLVTGHGPVGLSFSPDGSYFVAGNRDGTVDVFKVNR